MMTIGRSNRCAILGYNGSHYWVQRRHALQKSASTKRTLARGGMMRPTLILKDKDGNVAYQQQQRMHRSRTPKRTSMASSSRAAMEVRDQEEEWQVVSADEEADKHHQLGPDQRAPKVVKVPSGKDRWGDRLKEVMKQLPRGEHKPAHQEFLRMEKLRLEHYLRIVDNFPYCILCRKFSDAAHLNSIKHKLSWMDDMEPVERADQLMAFHEGVIDWIVTKADKDATASPDNDTTMSTGGKAKTDQNRGGMNTIRGEPSSGTSSSGAGRLQAPSIVEEKAPKGEEGVCTSPLGECDGDMRALAEALDHDNDGDRDHNNTDRPSTDVTLPQDDTSDEHSIDDDDLALQLAEEAQQRGHRRVWVRGPLAWLPLDCHITTSMHSIYLQAAITFLVSSDRVLLFWQRMQVARSGTIDTWHLPHNVELLLAKKPTVGIPSPPQRPLPVLDPIDLCNEDQQPEEANLDEAKEMEQLDYDVINIDIRTTRGTVQHQVCRGANLEDLVNHYARAKKVRPQRCSPYVPASDHILTDDQEIVILINQRVEDRMSLSDNAVNGLTLSCYREKGRETSCSATIGRCTTSCTRVQKCATTWSLRTSRATSLSWNSKSRKPGCAISSSA